MRKTIILFSGLLLVVIFTACNKSTNDTVILSSEKIVLTGDKPPLMSVEISDEMYETELGSYCWEFESESENVTECVDAIVPVEAEKKIEVNAGEKVTLSIDYTPNPNETHLSQEGTDVDMTDNQFDAPDEKGVYFYNYSVWWMDEVEKDVANGGADYGFILEVK